MQHIVCPCPRKNKENKQNGKGGGVGWGYFSYLSQVFAIHDYSRVSFGATIMFLYTTRRSQVQTVETTSSFASGQVTYIEPSLDPTMMGPCCFGFVLFFFCNTYGPQFFHSLCTCRCMYNLCTYIKAGMTGTSRLRCYGLSSKHLGHMVSFS